jgi:hypothetical protein
MAEQGIHLNDQGMGNFRYCAKPGIRKLVSTRVRSPRFAKPPSREFRCQPSQFRAPTGSLRASLWL